MKSKNSKVRLCDTAEGDLKRLCGGTGRHVRLKI